MIRAIERNTNGLVFKEDIEDFSIDYETMMSVRWFKLLKHRKALNGLIEMKLRLAALERELRRPDRCTECNVYEKGMSGAIALCEEVSAFFKDDEPLKLLDPAPIFEDEYFDVHCSRDEEGPLFDFARVVCLMLDANRHRFEEFFGIDCHDEYRKVIKHLGIPDIDIYSLIGEGSSGGFIKRLAAFREDEIPTNELYAYYLKAFCSDDYVDTLTQLMRGKHEPLTEALGTTLSTLMPHVVFDPVVNAVADLAYENLKDSQLRDSCVWGEDGIEFDSDFDWYLPSVREHYEAGARGTFVRLLLETAHKLDELTDIDVDTYEFDKGFCSFLALSIHNLNTLPDGLQIEFFRMCHYAGIEVSTTLYDFSQPCDYETHEYESVESFHDEDLPLMDTIDIKSSHNIEFEVDWVGGEEGFLKNHADDPIWGGRCKQFNDITEALAYARTLEKDRRQWVMDHYPDDRFLQAEVLDMYPRVSINPLDMS